MATYTEVKNGLDEIASRVAGVQAKFDNYGTSIQSAIAALDAIPIDHADIIAELDTNASTDPAWLNVKSERVQMQADFLSLRAQLQSLLDAYNAI